MALASNCCSGDKRLQHRNGRRHTDLAHTKSRCQRSLLCKHICNRSAPFLPSDTHRLNGSAQNNPFELNDNAEVVQASLTWLHHYALMAMSVLSPSKSYPRSRSHLRQMETRNCIYRIQVYFHMLQVSGTGPSPISTHQYLKV